MTEKDQETQPTVEEPGDGLPIDLEGLSTEPSASPAPQPTLTFEQAMQLVQLASKQQETPKAGVQPDPLEQKRAQFDELYKRLQQGENDAFMPFLQVQGEMVALQAERAAIQSSREQTAAIQATMNLNTVLNEMREKESKTPRGFNKLEANWYQRMNAEIQANPTLYASLEAVRKAGKLLMGEMYIDALERIPARAPNAVARNVGGYTAKDGPTAPSVGNLTPEAAAAGFTSEEEFKKYAKIAEGWIDL